MFGQQKNTQPEKVAETNTENAKMQENQPFSKNDLIIDVIQRNPNTVRAMMRVGMGCITCPASLMETVAQAAMVHGLDPDMLIDLLNEEPPYVAPEDRKQEA